MNSRCSSEAASKIRSHSLSAPIDRLFRLAEPILKIRSSTIMSLLCTITAASVSPFPDTG